MFVRSPRLLGRALGLALAATAVLASSGCNTPPPQQRLPQISFSHSRPFQLNVGQLEVVSEYQAPGREPNIEHLMPISPAQAATQWAQDRLRPMGRAGSARFVIRDAKVVEIDLKTDKGFKGLFKEEQAQRYEANLEVAVQVMDERGMFPVAEVVARASRSQTVPEGITLNQRDKVWFEMTEAMMKDINGQLENTIPQYMNQYLL